MSSKAPSFPSGAAKTGARALAGAALLGLGYASLIERVAFCLREVTLPVLSPATRPLRLLHISDLHMTPGQKLKQQWLRELDALEPDLVVNTGDNLAHTRAVPSVIQGLGGLLDRPGLFVFGSNDYFGPTPKNPARYLRKEQAKRSHGDPLPWQDLRAAFQERGWTDATHQFREFNVGGVRVASAGVDDPHLNRDRYDAIGALPSAGVGLRLGLTHSPEPRVLDRFAADGYDLVLAGHTHGGQLRLPGYGAIVTNCGIDRARARGASSWGQGTRLHVSAGLGTSPYAPARFCCRPEATLLTLVAKRPGGEPAPRGHDIPVGAAQQVGD